MGRTVIEVIHPNRLRKVYRVFDTPEIRVGRSFDNDLILPDPFVSESHLRITVGEEGWLIEDRGSVNGFFVREGASPLSRAACRSGDEIVLGRTRLRLLSPSHPVGPAKKLVQEYGLLRFARRPAGVVLSILFMVAVLTAEEYFGSYDTEPLLKLTAPAIVMLLVAALWAGQWAFTGRLIANRAWFSLHLALSTLFLALLSLGSEAAEYAGFAAGSEMVENGFLAVLFVLLFTVLMSQHLTVSTHLTPRRSITVSAALSLLIIFLAVFFSYAWEEEFESDPVFYSRLKPPVFGAPGGQPVERFVADADRLFEVEEDEDGP